MSAPDSKAPIQSTAGAIPVKNEKGEIFMQKVKVNRYVTGKKPEYAAQESSDEDDDFIRKRQEKLHEERIQQETPAAALNDRRLRRLQQTSQDDDSDRYARHQRRVDEPEVIGRDSDDDSDGAPSGSDDDADEEVDEEEIERRRTLLRERAKLRQEEEAMELAADKPVEGSSEEEESEYEEYTDSEEEDDAGPRLKPVFVRKKDRITIQEKQRQVLKERELELEAKRMAEERKIQARKMVENAGKLEIEQVKETQDPIDNINTDDENDEEEYEAWKVRELRRIKRDRDEREAIEKEKLEVDRLRNMTEEERKMHAKLNPKKITNQTEKGKYKFLQKYYHRGAFFLNEEEDVLKRNYTAPTLEDHFDKTILPKVMQVKNFGRSGRTKYTHLVDQDTTAFDSPWSDDGHQAKFSRTKSGGMKQMDPEKASSSKNK